MSRPSRELREPAHRTPACDTRAPVPVAASQAGHWGESRSSHLPTFPSLPVDRLHASTLSLNEIEPGPVSGTMDYLALGDTPQSPLSNGPGRPAPAPDTYVLRH